MNDLDAKFLLEFALQTAEAWNSIRYKMSDFDVKILLEFALDKQMNGT